MTLNEFLARLEKTRYFEGYSEAAIAKAVRAVRREYSAGLKGPHKQLFERFPGLALVVLEVDHEVSGLSDLKVILRQFAKASFGMFAPRLIKANWVDESNQCRLQFSVNGTKHSVVFEDISWIPNDFFDELHKTTRAECSGLEFEAIEYPDSGQSGYYQLIPELSTLVDASVLSLAPFRAHATLIFCLTAPEPAHQGSAEADNRSVSVTDRAGWVAGLRVQNERCPA